MSALTKLPENGEYFVQGGLIHSLNHRLSQPETNIKPNIKHLHISCKIKVHNENTSCF